jgi:hypothetical protein
MKLHRPLLWPAAVIASVAPMAIALDVGVGCFYAPGMAVGAGAEVAEFNPRSLGAGGALGLTKNLALSFDAIYAEYTYREPRHILPDIFGYEFFDVIPILTLNAGVDYAFPISSLVPYVAGGAVYAFEFAKYGYKTDVDIAPGVYAGAGVRYFLYDDVALAAGPRYTLLFDNPVYENNGVFLERAEAHSQLVNVLAGLDFFF